MADYPKPIFGPVKKIPPPTDSKVKEIVLETIGKEMASASGNQKGALLPSAFSPGVVLHFLSTFAAHGEAEVVPSGRNLKPVIRQHVRLAKYPPIGLRRCIPYTWINSFMQLVLFLPRFSEFFSFVPRSLDSLREFADQYLADQSENKSASLANSAVLVRCLMSKLSQNLFRIPRWVDLYSVFLGVCELLSIQYEGNIIWDVTTGLTLKEISQKKLQDKLPELLVGVRGMQMNSCYLIPKQFFTTPDWVCYDLDAFIEYRPDGQAQPGFIAYLKYQGTWYQCDDDRITVLRSSSLSGPLHRSVLLHYRKVSTS